MDEFLNEYREYLKIDRTDLESALLQQADLWFRVAEEHAKAVSIRDQAYENIKQTDAKLNKEIRSEYEAEGVRVTESAINAAVLTHPEHVEAVETYLEAKQRADKLAALKDSFQQRSYMLRELTQMFLHGHFVTATESLHEPAPSKVLPRMKKSEVDKRREALRKKLLANR